MQNPNHQITIEPKPGRVRVKLEGTVIADSAQALTLAEGKMQPVIYVPRADIAMEHLVRTEHGTHCPFKGDASYFTVEAGGRRMENAAWSYEQPFEDVAAIAGHLAFYPERLTIEDVA